MKYKLYQFRITQRGGRFVIQQYRGGMPRGNSKMLPDTIVNWIQARGWAMHYYQVVGGVGRRDSPLDGVSNTLLYFSSETYIASQC